VAIPSRRSSPSYARPTAAAAACGSRRSPRATRGASSDSPSRGSSAPGSCGTADGQGEDAQAAKKGNAKGGGRRRPDGHQRRHPRAAHGITRAKGVGGLVGLLLVGLLSLRAGAPLPDAGIRALAGGVVGCVCFWAVAVQAWRHLVVAEARAAAQRARDRAAAATQAAESA
jgi:hypothetical protein